MAAPSAPDNVLPKDGAILLDPFSPIQLAKTDIHSGESTSTEVQQLQVDYSEGWSNIANLDTASKSSYATAAEGGAAVRLECSSLNFSASDSDYIADIYLECVLKKTFDKNWLSDRIFFHWFHEGTGEEMNVDGNLDSVTDSNTQYDNDESNSYEFAFTKRSLEFFRRVTGKEKFTVAELEAVLPDCYLTIVTHDSLYSDVSEFAVSFIGLKIDHFSALEQTKCSFDIATDAGFTSIVYSATEGGEHNFHTVPIRKLAGGDYYLRSNQSNKDGASSYSTATQFSVMEHKAARLFHDSKAQLNIAVDLFPVLYFSPPAWSRDATYSNLFKVAVSRSDLWKEMLIDDVEEDGQAQSYTVYYEGKYVSDTEVYYTEEDILTKMQATAQTVYFNGTHIYIHPTNSLSPACWEGRSSDYGIILGIRLKMMISEKALDLGGIGQEYGYMPRLLSVPSLKDHINLWPSTGRAEGAGDIVLANHDKLFNTLMHHGENFRLTHKKLVFNGAKVVIRVIGNSADGVVYPEDGPVLFVGSVALDRSNVSEDEIRLSVLPRMLFHNVKVPKLIYSVSEAPELPSRVHGKPQIELVGSSFKRVPLEWIRYVQGSNEIWFKVGREAHIPEAVYKNGDRVASWSSWVGDAQDSDETVSGGSAKCTWYEEAQELLVRRPGADWYTSANWQIDISGCNKVDAASVAAEPGDVAKLLYTSRYFANLALSSFGATAFSDLNTVFTGDIRYRINSSTPIAAILEKFLLSVRSVPQTRLDGLIYFSTDLANRSTDPFSYSQYSTVFFEDDVNEKSWKTKLDLSNLCDQAAVKYHGYATSGKPEEALSDVGTRHLSSEGLAQKYKHSKLISVELLKKDLGTMAANSDGATEWTLAIKEGRFRKIMPVFSFEARRKAWLVNVGDPIIVYRRYSPFHSGNRTQGAVSAAGELEAALMIALTVEKHPKKAAGKIVAAQVDTLTGWKADKLPRLDF